MTTNPSLQQLQLADTGMAPWTMQLLLQHVTATTATTASSANDATTTLRHHPTSSLSISSSTSSSSLKVLNLNYNPISERDAMALTMTHVTKFPSALQAFFIVPSSSLVSPNHASTTATTARTSVMETKDVSLQLVEALHDNAHLTQFQLLPSEDVTTTTTAATSSSRTMQAMTQAIVQRNQLTKRLNAIHHDNAKAVVPLAVWPHYLANTTTTVTNSSPGATKSTKIMRRRRSHPDCRQVAHPPSLVYQVLHSLLPTAMVTTTATIATATT
eukprot:CAMPEP_0168816864 /NCGR_PEP_ID=MMETSP0726-20121227/6940_1 /TAXON_ID=265536 /ORGANISM="Amphiprora sp., Strain CCMP467" /LENGTH=271 /DNA_ID=CAMNT_0008869131 /DNA_START=51 /DNA_END=862 /DNA_ORIENTATION=+